jgi:hypothetical protein
MSSLFITPALSSQQPVGVSDVAAASLSAANKAAFGSAVARFPLTVYAKAAPAAATLTAADIKGVFLNGAVQTTGVAAATTLTLPAPADVLAALSLFGTPAVGASVSVLYVNNCTGTLTVTGVAGTVVRGTPAVATATAATLTFIMTNVTPAAEACVCMVA